MVLTAHAQKRAYAVDEYASYALLPLGEQITKPLNLGSFPIFFSTAT